MSRPMFAAPRVSDSGLHGFSWALLCAPVPLLTEGPCVFLRGHRHQVREPPPPAPSAARFLRLSSRPGAGAAVQLQLPWVWSCLGTARTLPDALVSQVAQDLLIISQISLGD